MSHVNVSLKVPGWATAVLSCLQLNYYFILNETLAATLASICDVIGCSV